MKRGCPDHPKTYALAEALGIRRVYAVGYLEMLFHFTAQYAPEGDIGRYSDKRIAAGIDWAGRPQKLIDALVATRWLDRHPVARLVVHDWSDHADRTTLQRLSRHGKTPIVRHQSDTADPCTQSESQKCTPPEPEPIPEPLPEPKPHTNGNAREWPDAFYKLPITLQDLFVALKDSHPKQTKLLPACEAFIGKVKARRIGQWNTPEIISAHTEASGSMSWQREGGRYAPTLKDWVENEGWHDKVAELQAARNPFEGL